MYGILCREVDFDFMARCKTNTFRKQSLLEMNVEHLDCLESAPCSGMLPNTSADVRNKQKNPFNLTQIFGECFKKKERCHSKQVKEEVQIMSWPLHPPPSLPTYR